MKRVFSGMRPTGPLHVGHLLGALENWAQLQKDHECYFMVADLHALMGEYASPDELKMNSLEMLLDWIACGIDPEKSVIFIQSQIAEHSELALILGMMTPLGWLERIPTYKEQLREIQGRDLTTYGFLGYPILQAADILLYKANLVPVGEDQLPHIEFTRELARRFNLFYKKNLFIEPEARLTASPRILGIDRRKMSKSYANAVNLSDDEASIKKKIQSMITDPKRIKMSDPGHPKECNVYSYFQLCASLEKIQQVHDWCVGAKKGCIDCKKACGDLWAKKLEPIRRKRAALSKDKAFINKVVTQGHEKAAAVAKKTMREVADLLHLLHER